MPNTNGLIEALTVCSTGDPNSAFYAKNVVTSDINCNDITITGSTIMTNLSQVAIPNTPNTTQRGTQTTRPLLIDSTNGNIVRPNQPMMRLIEITTPNGTGQPVLITDGSGNPYNAANWTCCVVGFFNGALATPGSADRTYGAICYYSNDRNWLVEYDQGSPSNQGTVTILAISNAMFVSGSN